MNPLPPILSPLLAERGWIEIIGGLIFVAFWIISALAGTLAKKKQEQEQQQQAEELDRILREEGRSPPAAPPSPPPLPGTPEPDRPPVTTRDEMERRMAEARERAARAEARRNAEEAQRRAQHAAHQEAQRRTTADTLGQSQRPTQIRPQTSDSEDFRREQQSVFQQEQRTRERERRRRPSPPPIVTTPTPRLAPLTPEPDTTVRRNVATDPLVFNTASPSAGQRPQIANAAAIRKWLTPQTLRQQYILTELFQPPLALREERPLP